MAQWVKSFLCESKVYNYPESMSKPDTTEQVLNPGISVRRLETEAGDSLEGHRSSWCKHREKKINKEPPALTDPQGCPLTSACLCGLCMPQTSIV